MINLHNHSTWSDGQYTPDQLARMAVVSRLTHLGISDHFFTAKLTGPLLYVDADEVGAYVDDIHRVAELHSKRLQVLAGLEIDWSPRAIPRLEALWPEIDRLDYVLFEYVQDEEWYGESLESLFGVLPHIHIPAGLAHNDLSRNFASLYSPEQLVALLESHDIFVEISTAPATTTYTRSDPYSDHLWQVLAESAVRFSVGSDTHNRIDDMANVADAHRFLEERGLLGRLITNWWDPVWRTWRGQQ
jgi:histidinol phosphatase-like PHP family hydrolase